MNGPDHYRAAEQLLAGTDVPADPETGQGPGHFPPSRMDLLTAQVHATLALAAATAMAAPVDGDPDTGMPPTDCHAWYVAAGVQPAHTATGKES